MDAGCRKIIATPLQFTLLPLTVRLFSLRFRPGPIGTDRLKQIRICQGIKHLLVQPVKS